MTDEMRIDYLDIDKIKPYKRNAKKHPQEQIDQIVKSIEQFGNNDPIAVWGKDNVIVEGHGRYLALKQMGVTGEVPVIHLDHLTDDERRVYGLVHNKLTMNSGFDYDLLEAEFNLIDPEEFDLDFYGFFDDDAEEPEKAPAEVTEDDFDESTVTESVCKRGQVWQLGNHRLMCGDSTSAEDVARLMNGEKADMVFTDPPYGYEYQSNMRMKSDKFDILANDDKILNFFPCLAKVSNGFVFICTTWKVLDKWLPLFREYYELTNMIIWDKGGGYIGDLEKTFGTDYEIILCSNNDKKLTNKRIGSIWKFDKDKADEYIHPTQKPVKLSANAIISTTIINNSVLDLFGGSGSTLIACEQLDRNCYMMEISPHYCDVIIKRWEDFTGRKAELIEE